MLDADELMRHAIAACRRGIANGQTPFGAAIGTRDGGLVCAVHNSVRCDCDITAHAEIKAIRVACRELSTIDLSGHVIATTCEPCPMCAAAIHWARLETVYCGASIIDAARAGFHELHLPCERLYREGGSVTRVITAVLEDECRGLFEEWLRGPNPLPY